MGNFFQHFRQAAPPQNRSRAEDDEGVNCKAEVKGRGQLAPVERTDIVDLEVLLVYKVVFGRGSTGKWRK